MSNPEPPIHARNYQSPGRPGSARSILVVVLLIAVLLVALYMYFAYPHVLDHARKPL